MRVKFQLQTCMMLPPRRAQSLSAITKSLAACSEKAGLRLGFSSPPGRRLSYHGGGLGEAAAKMMEIAYPALTGMRGIGCITKTAPNENKIDSTGTPFRVPTLLSDTVAKTCTELCLNTCELEELPPLIGMYYLLKVLDVSGNKLEELPPDIGTCYSLKTLNVSQNRLKMIPDELSQLIHLEKFFAYSNQIVQVPEWLASMALTELNMFNNKILKIPPVFGELRLVTDMNFGANVIMQVPQETIEHWRSVRVLNLYDCRIIKLGSLSHMMDLEELRLFNNNLEELPDLGTKPKLRILELNKNHITNLPLAFFTGLKALERVTFNNNNIESIPVGINCPKLESFLIAQNALHELPPDLPLWPSLKILFVNGNQLQRLPETFLQNTWIQRINLARNSKCAASSKHILQHLKKVAEKNKGFYWAPDTL
jgi:Leucine-rich repeat (LRR) protein